MTCAGCPQLLTDRQVRRRTVFCSVGCATKTRFRRLPSPTRQRWTAPATAASQAHYRERVLKGVLEDLRPFVQPDGRLELKDAVKVLLKHRRTAYTRGWAAYHARRKRGAAA